MQSPMMIAFVQSREKEWQRYGPAEPRPVSGLGSGRAWSVGSPLPRVAIALVLLCLLALSQLDAVSARSLPVCNQATLRQIRPDLTPPLLGTPCGSRPTQPLPLAETESTPLGFELPDLAELWAIVVDLLPYLVEVTDPQTVR